MCLESMKTIIKGDAERNGGSLERADISDMHVYVVLAYNFI